ncbi:hypothetical protein AC579_2076 [Pseudocercospora musae]|uniref:Uncharacterized protein n=1 Tax=Pseudocercospora musae TaxID=113226 RepID=A0A139GXJ2_9PEZI|nr:hypothetical protein AC579_2076 [Pseudocercospora musae]
MPGVQPPPTPPYDTLLQEKNHLLILATCKSPPSKKRGKLPQLEEANPNEQVMEDVMDPPNNEPVQPGLSKMTMSKDCIFCSHQLDKVSGFRRSDTLSMVSPGSPARNPRML